MALRCRVGWVLAATVLGVAPLSGCSHLPPAEFYDYRGGEGRVVRVVSPFEDMRARWTAIGDSPRIGDSPSYPPEQFAERLAKELQRAGYTVLGADDPGSGDVLEVRGTLRSLLFELFMNHRWVFEADVWIELHASTPSGLSAGRSFYVKESASPTWCLNWFCDSMRQELIDRSAARAVREMTAAVLSLTNRYPAAPIAPVAAPATAATDTPEASEADPHAGEPPPISCLAMAVDCPRHIVASPEKARANNDLYWHIEPESQARPTPSPPAETPAP